jgi:hypothetical protein
VMRTTIAWHMVAQHISWILLLCHLRPF